jgi:hypothetical protein
VGVGDCGFTNAYTIELDPEYPGNGQWDCPVVSFDRTGAVVSAIEWGSPFVVRIHPANSKDWVVILSAPPGGLGPVRGAFATPEPHLLVVVVDGLAYLLDTRSPRAPAQIIHEQVQQVATCPDPPLLLIVGYIDIVAVGPSGIAWQTPRLCLDFLEVREINAARIVCSGRSSIGDTATITLDPLTGDQLDGPRFT